MDAVDAYDLAPEIKRAEFQALLRKAFRSRKIPIEDGQHRRAMARNPLLRETLADFASSFIATRDRSTRSAIAKLRRMSGIQ